MESQDEGSGSEPVRVCVAVRTDSFAYARQDLPSPSPSCNWSPSTTLARFIADLQEVQMCPLLLARYIYLPVHITHFCHISSMMS